MFEEYPEVVNVDVACEMMQCGRNNLYRLLNSDNAENKLKAYKNGRVWKIPKLAIQQYILEQAKIKKT